MIPTLRLLLVEDSEDDAALVTDIVKAGGYDVAMERVETADGMRAALARQPWDVVISDYTLPRFSGPESLRVLKQVNSDTPFILVSGTIGEDVAVEAMKAGADDYLMKGRLERLVPAIRRELREAVARRERRTLSEQLALLNTAMLAAPNCVAITDEHGAIEWVNPAFTALTGFSADEVVGQNPRILKSGRQPAQFYAELWRTIAGGESWHGEMINRRKDGTLYHEDSTIAPVRDSAGAIRHFVAIKQDISARKTTEEKLKLFRTLIEHSIDAIEVVDCSDRRLVDVNAAACRMLGYTREELLGRTLPEVTAGMDAAGISAISRRAKTMGPLTFEGLHRRKDGSTFPVEVSVAQVSHEREYEVAIVRDITARKKADAALRESEERLQLALTATRTGVWEWNVRTNAVYWSPECFVIYGAKTEYVTFEGFLKLVHPDDLAAFNRAVERALSRKGEFLHEFRAIRPDGRIIWLHNHGKVECDEAGKPTRVVGTVRDITEARQAEAALRESEERFRNLAENTSDWIWEINELGRYTYASPRVYDLLGYEPTEVLDRTPFEFMPPAEAVRVAEYLAPFMAAHRPFAAVENINVHKDGHLVVLESSAMPIFEVTGACRGYRGIDRDITERKRAERQIRDQAELIDKANEAIVAGDLTGRITVWNRGAERLSGWSAAEAIGRPIHEILRLAGVGLNSGVLNSLTAIADWRGEFRGRNRRGDEIDVEANVTVLRDDQGRPTGRLAICTDVTEKKKLEERFLRAQRLESLGMLAAGIAHDLNNVLAPIGMASTLLRKRVSDTGDLKLLTTLERCADRGAGLVKQILGFAHGVGGEFRLVHVKHLLRDVIQVITETFPKSIRLEESVPSDLCPVMANPTQLHQVLMNLCVNARDAMPQGGTLRLRGENCSLDDAAARAIEGGRRGRWLVLHVEDTGIGIAPEVIPRIWEPFFTTKAAEKGTGLGLSTVRGIVETHHGFITLQTESGCGTAFRIYLPAIDASDAERGTVRAVAPPRGHGEHIVIVDDEEAIRATAATILERSGYLVVTAGDGAEAAAILQSATYDVALVITDCDMPVVDGPHLAAFIRTHKRGIKILAMSGLNAPAADASGAFDAFLPKPFTFDTLLDAVEQVLHGPSAQT